MVGAKERQPDKLRGLGLSRPRLARLLELHKRGRADGARSFGTRVPAPQITTGQLARLLRGVIQLDLQPKSRSAPLWSRAALAARLLPVLPLKAQTSSL